MKRYFEDLEKSWKSELGDELNKPYLSELVDFLNTEKKKGKKIYPEEKNLFQAFEVTPFKKVKVIILGQDPYHGEGQAHGMCFSVLPGMTVPPSLKNIYKELNNDIEFHIPNHGYLLKWAKQGVFLLNTTLSVEESKPGSHQKKGWEIFTDKVISILNEKKENLVFLLWGSHAQKKIKILNMSKHLILQAPHPSPLSAYRGFFDCKHFSKTNQFLISKNIQPINWQI